jgi:DNA-binding PadR family transcriptional regulator
MATGCRPERRARLVAVKPKPGGVAPSVRSSSARRVSLAPRRAIKAKLEHALLGIIAEVPEISGYDIVKLFNYSTAHYWHAHAGQIYPTLERMVTDGLIRSRDVIQHGRPNKRLFTITTEGQRVLIEWLQSPFEGLKLKHAPLLRCRFLGHLGAEGAREKLVEEREAWREYLNVYRDIERMVFSYSTEYPDVNMMFSYFTLRRGIDWMEENIRWCDWAIAEVEKHRALFAKKSEPAAAGDAAAVTRKRATNQTRWLIGNL